MKTTGLVLAALAFPAIASLRTQTPTTIVYRLAASPAALIVDPKPRVDLGASGAAEELFHRIVAVRQQSSGRIVVATRDPVEMRIFDGMGATSERLAAKSWMVCNDDSHSLERQVDGS